MSTHIEFERPITTAGLKAGEKARVSGMRTPNFAEGAACLIIGSEERWERKLEKLQLQAEVFNDHVELWAESLALRGVSPEILKQRKARAQLSHSRSTSTEKEKHSKLIQEAAKDNFQIVFNTRAVLLQELLRENGSTETQIDGTISIWGRIFKNKLDKKQHPELKKEEIQKEMKHLATDINHLLIVRFPHYADSWETFLTKSGKSQEEAKQETNLWRTKFAEANDLGKAEISKDLRVRVMNAPSREFNSLIRDYARLVDQGLLPQSRRGFISEEEWKDKFDKANVEEQMQLIEALSFVLSRELDRVAEKRTETVFSS